ncbi:MAG: alkaline phosphatase family protein [Myxococcota bacterium]
MLVLALACAAPDRAPGGTVVIVGMDGLDVEELGALRLPTFQRVADEGFLTTFRVPTSPIWSPVIWTSLASGYPPEVHGVTHWARPDGNLYNSDHVLAKRIWDVASEQGWVSSVIAWPITSPARPLRGVQVAGGWAPSMVGPGREVALPEGHASPEELGARVLALAPPRGWLTDRKLALQVELVGFARHPASVDEYTLRAWEALFEPRTQSLSLLYLCGADQVGHLVDPATRERTFGKRSLRGADVGPAWVRAYYRYLDDALARVVARMDPARDTLVVLSDHGFRLEGEAAGPDHRHRQPAVLMGWGRRAHPGATAGDADMYDVAATLHALAGLPLARDFVGEPIAGAFRYPDRPEPVATWVVDARGKPPPPESASDAATAGQLRALGYLDEEGKPAREAPGPKK